MWPPSGTLYDVFELSKVRMYASIMLQRFDHVFFLCSVLRIPPSIILSRRFIFRAKVKGHGVDCVFLLRETGVAYRQVAPTLAILARPYNISECWVILHVSVASELSLHAMRHLKLAV